MKTLAYIVLFAGLRPAVCQFVSQTLVVPAMQTAAVTSPEQLQALLATAHPPLVLQPDDEIAVLVFGIPDFLPHQRVASDGTIAFPLIGRVQVSGLTEQELQAILTSRLGDGGFVLDPQVTVVVQTRPSNVITVSGLVAKPGMFPALSSLTLMDGLSLAGGIVDEVGGGPNAVNSLASSTVTLVRNGAPSPYLVPLGPDPMRSPYARIPILAGDEIRVSKMGVVYAVGALKNQGVFPLKNSTPTTVMQIISLAGGIGFEASAESSRIVRTVSGQKIVLQVNVKAIMRGNAPDVSLQADDIVFVPTTLLKAALKSGGANLAVSIASAYLYSSR